MEWAPHQEFKYSRGEEACCRELFNTSMEKYAQGDPQTPPNSRDEKENLVFSSPLQRTSQHIEKLQSKQLSKQSWKNFEILADGQNSEVHSSKRAGLCVEQEVVLWTLSEHQLMTFNPSEGSQVHVHDSNSFCEVLFSRTYDNQSSKDASPAAADKHLKQDLSRQTENLLGPKQVNDTMEQEEIFQARQDISELDQSKMARELPDSGLLEFIRFVSDDDSLHTKSSGKSLPDEQLVRMIIEQMGSKRNDLSAQLQGLRSLRNLSYNEERRALIGKLGGIVVAIDAMKDFATCEELAVLTLSFLTDVCQLNVFNKLQIGNGGGIDIVIAAIYAALDQSLLSVETCCDALCTFCNDCELNQTIAADRGALEALLTTVRRGKRSRSLQEKCLRTMFAVIVNQRNSVALFEESGGVEEVLAILQQFSDEECIQIAAMQVASELIRQSDVIRQHMGSAGIIKDIQRVLPRLTLCKSYLHHCCCCIRYLAFIDANRIEMATGTIVPLLAETIVVWKGDETVVIGIMLALSNLTYDVYRSKHEAARGGRVQILLELLHIHKSRRVITEETCRLLRNISDGRMSTKRICVRGGVVRAVAAAMKAQPASPGVQEHGAALMINLSHVCGAALDIMGLEQHIDRVLTLHSTAPGTTKQLLHLRQVLYRLKDRSNSFATFLLGAVPIPGRRNATDSD